MRRGTIKSTFLKSVGYDEKKNILQVEMRADGVILNVHEVPFAVVKRPVQSKSPGAYMNNVVQKRLQIYSSN
jgi:KTSC domain-containing protein